MRIEKPEFIFVILPEGSEEIPYSEYINNMRILDGPSKKDIDATVKGIQIVMSLTSGAVLSDLCIFDIEERDTYILTGIETHIKERTIKEIRNYGKRTEAI